MATKKKVKLEPREEVFLEIIQELWRYGGDEIKELANEAGVHYSTIYNWRNAKTLSPRISTFIAVAKVLGYTVVLQRVQTSTPRLRVVQ